MVRRRNQNQFQVLNNDSGEREQEQSMNSAGNSIVGNDNTSMILVTNVFNGENYLPWSKSIKLALMAKEKTDFILKDEITPAENTAEYQTRCKTDCLVTSWILNSMTKEFAEAFLYTTSVRSLWKELEDMFGGSNGPRLFQLKREISMLQQGNSSIMICYTKLKKLWDELDLLRVYPSCICIVAKECICNVQQRTNTLNEVDKLIQFLMGLHEGYEAAKSQILLMDPFPTLHKAYAMLQRIEKQREVIVQQPL